MTPSWTPTEAERFEIVRAASEEALIHALPNTAIDVMEARRHDVEYQLRLCHGMMALGELLPSPFRRAVILLAKAKRYAEEAELCAYAIDWGERAKRSPAALSDPHAARVWVVADEFAARLPKAEARALRARR